MQGRSYTKCGLWQNYVYRCRAVGSNALYSERPGPIL